MNIKLKADFYFKGNGKKKTVIWTETNPRLQQKDKDTDEVIREIPLTAEEVKQEYQRLFIKHKNEGKAITLDDIENTAHIIDLAEVREIKLTAEKEETSIEL